MVYHCSPTIENCTFETTDDYAIVVSSGNPLIADCTFIECDAAIWLWDSDANITNCTFLRNRYGIESEWGSPTIDNCTFSYTNYTAIEVDTNGAAVLGDNEFIGNGKDVVTKDMALSDLYFALIMVIMMSSTLLIMLGWELRKKWKKGRKRRKKWRLKRHDDLAGDPVTVVCPNCSTENEVTDTRRPYEFRCEVCASLLRLKG